MLSVYLEDYRINLDAQRSHLLFSCENQLVVYKSLQLENLDTWVGNCVKSWAQLGKRGAILLNKMPCDMIFCLLCFTGESYFIVLLAVVAVRYTAFLL